jgi:hypothetical protein
MALLQSSNESLTRFLQLGAAMDLIQRSDEIVQIANNTTSSLQFSKAAWSRSQSNAIEYIDNAKSKLDVVISGVLIHSPDSNYKVIKPSYYKENRQLTYFRPYLSFWSVFNCYGCI